MSRNGGNEIEKYWTFQRKRLKYIRVMGCRIVRESKKE